MQQREITVSNRTTRRIGYGVAIAVNVALLFFVNNLLDWGWFGWLTEDLNDVIPLINFSLVASIVANAAYFANDSPGFKGVLELAVNTISLVVVIRLLQVFPFDFSEHSSAWETATRSILIVAIVGISLAMLVEFVKLVQIAVRAAEQTQHDHS